MEAKKNKKPEIPEEREVFQEESRRGFNLPKETALPRGFQTFTPDEYFSRQQTQNEEQTKINVSSCQKKLKNR